MIVSLDADTATVAKVATTPAEAERLDREAAVLAAARHPGVVRLRATRAGSEVEAEAARAGSEADADRARLEIGAVTGWCLSDLFRLDPAEVAGLGCAVATILADLHDIGVVHGSVEASHVLVGGDGRPVLCSLGLGRVPHSNTGPNPEDDVRALMAMLASLLPPPDEGGGATTDLVRRALRSHPCPAWTPGRRFGRRRRRPLWTGAPTARRLAARLAEVPGARLPDPSQAKPARAAAAQANAAAAPAAARAATPPTSRKWWLVGAAALVVAATASGVTSSLRRPSSGICPKVDRGCRPIDHRSGEVVAESGRFLLGDASSDPLVLGRWTCGPALPALLRLDRGEVWVWGQWPADGHAAAARLAGRVDDAETLRVSAGASGCDDLAVISRGGRITTLAGRRS
jgi:hypothetical protein